MRVRVNGIEQQMKETMMECEDMIKKSIDEVEVEEKHQAMITQVEGYITKQEKAVENWKTCFSHWSL